MSPNSNILDSLNCKKLSFLVLRFSKIPKCKADCTFSLCTRDVQVESGYSLQEMLTTVQTILHKQVHKQIYINVISCTDNTTIQTK